MFPLGTRFKSKVKQTKWFPQVLKDLYISLPKKFPCVSENNRLCHQTLPPFFPVLFFFPPLTFLSLCFTFYSGRHPGQIAALKISFEGC